ncbi:hypothetical protein BU16DRAFT_567975 [Lophium mytilinum]|uniref:Uncharacterized protein n=1 Tax=Lophium mytilinum TaxID=390894 RepID=A0A6A6QAK7_9PEZI|nr:hypothetical protein BU16DRAFT_567975 [Lophium mytilinum]
MVPGFSKGLGAEDGRERQRAPEVRLGCNGARAESGAWVPQIHMSPWSFHQPTPFHPPSTHINGSLAGECFYSAATPSLSRLVSTMRGTFGRPLQTMPTFMLLPDSSNATVLYEFEGSCEGSSPQGLGRDYSASLYELKYSSPRQMLGTQVEFAPIAYASAPLRLA